MTTLLEVRLALYHGGYGVPLPCRGKIPAVRQWEKRTATNEQEIELWVRVWADAINTGILCADIPCLDADILTLAAAEAIERLILDRYDGDDSTVLVRVGLPPKRLFPFRLAGPPFGKIIEALTNPAGGEGEKLEFLANGQQAIFDGIHPDTGLPYAWRRGSPLEVPVTALQEITESEARELIADCTELLIAEHGYSRPGKARANGHGHGTGAAGAADDHGQSFSPWREVIANILLGRDLHDTTTILAAKLVKSGMAPGIAGNLLRGLYENSVAPRDARFSARFDEIDRAVDSAEIKFGAKAAPGAAPNAGLGIWNAGTMTELPPPRQWLLGNSFCRRLVSALIASGGTGKTALRILQAISLAAGKELTGENVFQRTRVLLVLLEDDADELRRRILAARMHHGISEAELDGWLYLSAPGAEAGKLLTANPRTGALAVGTLAARIEKAVAELGVGLVIIDPLIKAHSVSENSNEHMDALAQLLAAMATKHGIAIDLPHHVAKGAVDPGNADRGRGASATNNAARMVYTLSTMAQAEAERFGIADDVRRGYVRLDRAKLNHARSAGSAMWFHLVSVSIGNGTPDYPAGDSVQTLEPWVPPETWEGLDAGLLNQILTAIDAGPGGGNFYTHANAATDRAAWEVVQRFAPQKTESQCREIVTAWVKSGLLVKFDYENPQTRKTVKGLRVDNDKRPQ